MDYDQWFKETNQLLDTVIEDVMNSTDKVTPADVGLILHVCHDYIENNSDNSERDIVTLKIAEKILTLKYKNEDISWFDIYDILSESNSKTVKLDRQKEEGESPSSFESLFRNTEYETSHQKEFQKSFNKIYEALNSDRAKKLEEEPPEKIDGFNHLSCSLSNKSDVMYGMVEIPNNLSRMRITSNLSCFGKDLSETDYIWVINSVKHWLRIYVRAESTIANRNTDRDTLHKFMLDEETPRQRYWS